MRDAYPHLNPIKQDTELWLDRLEERHDDLHGLVERLLTSEPPTAGEMAAALWRFWWLRGHMAEGREFLEQVSKTKSPSRVEALKGLGTIAFRQGDVDAAEQAFRARLDLVRAGGRQRDIADAYADLARIALHRGDFAAVRKNAELGYAAARDLGPDAVRAPLHMRAAAARMEGQLAEARTLYLESRELNEQLGNDGNVAGEDHNLFYVALHSGDREEAVRRFRASSEWVFAHDDAYVRPYALLDAGILALHDGAPERACRLVAAAQRIFEAGGSVPDPDDRVELDGAVAKLKAGLGARYESVWAEGRKLSLLEAQAMARE